MTASALVMEALLNVSFLQLQGFVVWLTCRGAAETTRNLYKQTNKQNPN